VEKGKKTTVSYLRFEKYAKYFAGKFKMLSQIPMAGDVTEEVERTNASCSGKGSSKQGRGTNLSRATFWESAER